MSESEIQDLLKIKSPGVWNRDESGGLSAVFQVGWSKRTFSEQKLKSLNVEVFNALADLRDELNNSMRENMIIYGKNGFDKENYRQNPYERQISKKCDTLERIQDVVQETLKGRSIMVLEV